jgi:molybdate transport system substrate-binding protein
MPFASIVSLLTALIVMAVSGHAFAAGPGTSAPQKLTIYAAASLRDSLPAAAAAWKTEGGSDVTFSFDASSRLARQIDAGAPADLFFSADEMWMDFLAEKNRLQPETRRSLLTNELVLIAPYAARGEVKLPEVKKLALAGEQVPAGKYAAAALRAAGYLEQLQPRIVRGDHVRTVLTWVAAGDVPAGIVYRTDALSIPEKVRIVHTFPASSHPVISYPAAVLSRSKAADAAKAFLGFCRSERGRKIFEQAGFTAAPGT